MNLCACGCGTPVRRTWSKGHWNRKPGLPYTIAENGCWVWQRAKGGRGQAYGYSRMGGKWQPAHRGMWIETHGPLPDDWHVHHLCGTKLCVNPEHLEAMSGLDHNSASGHGKLTPADVRRIRALVAAGGTHAAVAAQFAVGRRTVGDIFNRRIWKTVV